ncbi:unnamed protein product [Cuscuta campestris]|uniref:Late embryogenesis abundant protein LEA-2 subgroup domain-containing protein n=1 Tax=Cuscuta campestris TaxID=132261 RepID=A0A484NQF0_9ASTE|nr:unnamed protein product [Cuscuta campestris]
MAYDDDHRERSCCGKRSIIIIIIILFVVAIVVIAIVASSKDKDDPKLPEYSVVNAALSQNAAVTNNSLVTGDFTFTLKAANTNKKNVTVFYGNTTHVSITHLNRWHVVASTSSPSISPSSLGPGNSSDVTVRFQARNNRFSFPNDDYSPTDVYELVLRMRFRVGFKEGSDHSTKVQVTCFDFKCRFPEGFTADSSPKCRSEEVPFWQYFPGDDEQGRP